MVQKLLTSSIYISARSHTELPHQFISNTHLNVVFPVIFFFVAPSPYPPQIVAGRFILNAHNQATVLYKDDADQFTANSVFLCFLRCLLLLNNKN